MFAINHASTALVLKRRYPAAPLALLLLSVQAVELLWVALNYLGIERTSSEASVRYVGDLHLEYMPYSHSVATTLLLAALVWLVAALAGRRRLGVALALGVTSHIVLDLLTHNQDIALAPFLDGRLYGTALYAGAPAIAFAFELVYGIGCWWIYGGSRLLLALIVVFNLANISFFFRSIPGPEGWLAGRPTLTVTLILFQILLTLAVVAWGAQKPRARSDAARP